MVVHTVRKLFMAQLQIFLPVAQLAINPPGMIGWPIPVYQSLRLGRRQQIIQWIGRYFLFGRLSHR